VLVAGCGDGASETEKVKAAVATYLDAFAAGDGQRACDQLTGEQVRVVTSIAIEEVPELGGRSCAEAVARLAQQLGADERAMLRGVEVFDVAIHGDTAPAFLKRGAPIGLCRADGRWLIASGIGNP
jgi:hypothetical protein